MASSELLTHLRYLNDAAHLLAASAPETSRHLMLRQNSLLLDSNLDRPESQQHKACGACGTIKILGWNGTLETDQTGRKGKRRREAVRTEKFLVYTCDSCGRKTRHPVPAPPKISRPQPRSSRSIPISAPSSSNTAQPSGAPGPAQTSNSNSKKRAKNRKQSSLSALLAKQKASQGGSGSGFGLDLMDFMNKG